MSAWSVPYPYHHGLCSTFISGLCSTLTHGLFPTLTHDLSAAGSELSPPREDLLTQQGGTVAFSGEDTMFRHSDSGILKYTVGG